MWIYYLMYRLLTFFLILITALSVLEEFKQNTSKISTIVKLFVVSPLPPFSEMHILTEPPFPPPIPPKMQGYIFLVYKAIINNFIFLLAPFKKKNSLKMHIWLQVLQHFWVLTRSNSETEKTKQNKQTNSQEYYTVCIFFQIRIWSKYRYYIAKCYLM